MLTTLLIVALLIALVYVFLSLAGKALHSRRTSVRILGGFLGMLMGGLFALVAIVALAGIWRVEAPRAHPVAAVTVEVTPELVARGEQLAWLCAGCHAADEQLPLNGGRRNLLTLPLPLGTVYGPNLTPASRLGGWKDGEIIRAIREGIDAQGVPMVAMPSQSYHNMSDEDAAALVAYLRSQPALHHDQPRSEATILSYLLLGVGLAPTSEQPPITGAVTSPARGVTPEYGRYLVSIAGCADCHGAALDGVPPNQFVPPGPTLRTVGQNYTAAAFVNLFRSGQAPGGRTVTPAMPWQLTGRAMTDDDLKAMHAYLSGMQ